MAGLLVLGGTSFVGRHLVEAATAGGHDVTVFNRGRTNTDLFPDVERLTGDRSTGDYAALAGRSWDACVDVNAYFPRQVTEAAAALAGAVGHCTYVSTVSVYAPSRKPVDETSGLVDPTPGVGADRIDGSTYGPLKVLCEQAAAAAYDGQVSIVRPGYVVGPHDPTGRFTHWVRRVTRPGPMLAPRPDMPVQVVHARDLADVMLRITLDGVRDTVNVVGPSSDGVAMRDVVDACATAAGVEAPEVIWVDDEWVVSTDLPLPLFSPESDDAGGTERASCRKAEALGLVNRPLVESARDTLGWLRSGGDAERAADPLPAEREAQALAAWRAR